MKIVEFLFLESLIYWWISVYCIFINVRWFRGYVLRNFGVDIIEYIRFV